MWTDPDNGRLRQSRWSNKRRVHNLNHCHHGCGTYITNAIPGLQVQARPKCNIHNSSSLAKALAFIKRAFSREPVEYQPTTLQLHNLNYDHQQFNRLQQQQYQYQHQHQQNYSNYGELYWNDIFASASSRKPAGFSLITLQQSIQQFFWNLSNSVQTTPFHQIMLQQRTYTMTSLQGINKCEQMPSMMAFNRRLDAAKQMDSIKESTNLLSNAMSSIISSTTDFFEDLMSCLPGTTTELFKTDVKPTKVADVAVEPKTMSPPPPPPPVHSDKIACIEFYSKPTYCYFVIDICAHDLDSVDVWHEDSHVATPPVNCSKKRARSTPSSSGINGDNDANNNSCQMDSSLLSCKSGTSPFITDCSPDICSDTKFWTERNGRRRERNISECSDDFICFMSENEEDEMVTDEEDDDDEDDDDDADDDDVDVDNDEDDDDDYDEVEDVDEVDRGVCHWHRNSFVNSTHDFHNIQQVSKCGKNKSNTRAHRPHDKHVNDNDDNNAIIPVPVSSCSEKNKNNTNARLELKPESSTTKRVRFDSKPEIHTMHAWNYAYRKARKGNWEDFARDRARFQQRIQRTAVYLNPVLTAQHRSKVYKSRFTTPLNA